MNTNTEKWRRMALRRALGTRKPSPSKGVVALAESYLVAHACFACRKSFKIHPRQDAAARCPQCSKEIHWMGRSFKAPAMGNTEQWRKVQALYAYGFRFFSCRSHPAAPPLPERFRDVRHFVAANPAHPFRVAPLDTALLPAATSSLSLRRGRV
ncbi:hypothetical protein [Solimonas sp. K1W22B-7]|uniref:hypothetical protein n=1 Tax=Solimonas sp. K1W22B-7 TaxID=2303331 RepID=UPI0013C45A47|nr:hypothetical protein [Solimonas sp. K1W22B-7]